MISDGSKAITQDSCHIQTNVNGYDVESCFCDKDRCNSGNNIKVINLLFLLGIVFLTTLSPLLAPVINL